MQEKPYTLYSNREHSKFEEMKRTPVRFENKGVVGNEAFDVGCLVRHGKKVELVF